MNMSPILLAPFPVLALYAATNALIMLVLGVLVVRARVKTRTEIGDGGNLAMMAAVRAHANNTEYVPVALLLMLILIPLRANAYVIHAIGATLHHRSIAARFRPFQKCWYVFAEVSGNAVDLDILSHRHHLDTLADLSAAVIGTGLTNDAHRYPRHA